MKKKLVPVIVLIAVSSVIVSCGHKQTQTSDNLDSLDMAADTPTVAEDAMADTVAEVPTIPTTENSASSDESVSSSESSVGDVDAALDEYEEYVNKYAVLLKKASKGDASAVTEYAEMLQSAQGLQEKLDKAKGDFTPEQMNRLVKIETKLLKSMK